MGFIWDLWDFIWGLWGLWGLWDLWVLAGIYPGFIRKVYGIFFFSDLPLEIFDAFINLFSATFFGEPELQTDLLEPANMTLICSSTLYDDGNLPVVRFRLTDLKFICSSFMLIFYKDNEI